jgi:hypothetical protein
MRRRLAALIGRIRDLENLSSVVPQELGLDVPPGLGSPRWDKFLQECELRDVLDLITVAFRELLRRQKAGFYEVNSQLRWIQEVRRILIEENVHYTVDDFGGVHFRFDSEFAHNSAAAVGAIQADRYANVLHGYEGAMAALGQAPPDGKGAIRSIFAAVEGIFKLILPDQLRLGAIELDRLEPLLQRHFAQDATAGRAAQKMRNSLKDWVEAAHFYRHEQGAEAVVQPPLRMAVYIVSTGARICAGWQSLTPHFNPRASIRRRRVL